MSDGAAMRAGQARRSPGPMRLLLAVGIFGLAGPPFGGLAAWLLMGARSLRSPLPFITGAYAEGITLALCTGAIVAAVAFSRGGSHWLAAVVAALLVNA